MPQYPPVNTFWRRGLTRSCDRNSPGSNREMTHGATFVVCEKRPSLGSLNPKARRAQSRRGIVRRVSRRGRFGPPDSSRASCAGLVMTSEYGPLSLPLLRTPLQLSRRGGAYRNQAGFDGITVQAGVVVERWRPASIHTRASIVTAGPQLAVFQTSQLACSFSLPSPSCSPPQVQFDLATGSQPEKGLVSQ